MIIISHLIHHLHFSLLSCVLRFSCEPSVRQTWLDAFGAAHSAVSRPACSTDGKRAAEISCWRSTEGQTLHSKIYLSALHDATAGGPIKRFLLGVSNDFSHFNLFPLLFPSFCRHLSVLWSTSPLHKFLSLNLSVSFVFYVFLPFLLITHMFLVLCLYFSFSVLLQPAVSLAYS